jgi:hypothetical protein
MVVGYPRPNGYFVKAHFDLILVMKFKHFSQGPVCHVVKIEQVSSGVCFEVPVRILTWKRIAPSERPEGRLMTCCELVVFVEELVRDAFADDGHPIFQCHELQKPGCLVPTVGTRVVVRIDIEDPPSWLATKLCQDRSVTPGQLVDSCDPAVDRPSTD